MDGNGFRAFLDGGQLDNFSRIEASLGSQKECERYWSAWVSKYRDVFAHASGLAIVEWDIRLHRALKGLFTAASFDLEARCAADQGAWAAHHYLCYYALFHVSWSLLILLPTETAASVASVTHSKVRNVVTDHFSNRVSPLLDRAAFRHVFDTLQFAREYSSYRLPMNSFLADLPEVAAATRQLPELVAISMQVCNLHSFMLERASRHVDGPAADCGSIARNTFAVDVFNQLNAAPHPTTREPVLDYTDRVALNERLRFGFQVHSFSIVIEHFIDEFRGYAFSDERAADAVTQGDVWKYVWDVMG